jgi:soluble lytic murein transglycosylase-like protein
MNVNATASRDYNSQHCTYDMDPIAVQRGANSPGQAGGNSPAQPPGNGPIQPGENGEDERHPIPQPAPAVSLSAIQKQFGALISDLTRQLSSLEKQLMQSLRQLTAERDEMDSNAPQVSREYPPFNRYGKIITEAARKHEIDPLLVGAVINQESGFRADAVSKAGAVGLMQLMPETARSLGVNDARNPQQNVEGGTALLRQLLDRYNGQLDLALAAYNAGPEAVDKYGGIPPFPETQAYVRDVMESYRASALSA